MGTDLLEAVRSFDEEGADGGREKSLILMNVLSRNVDEEWDVSGEVVCPREA